VYSEIYLDMQALGAVFPHRLVCAPHSFRSQVHELMHWS